jgi:rhamnulokinase
LHLAIDLGAGSGRAILGRLEGAGSFLHEAHRFHYPPREAAGHLRWDFELIWAGVGEGLRAASAAARERGGTIASVGVDSWAVDYGLVDARGRLLEDPACYRDPSRTSAMEEVLGLVSREELYARAGIQFLPFNTAFQLYAHVREGLPPEARRLLMIPDLCHHRLAGSLTGEYTNASSTSLLDARSRRWDDGLFTLLGLPRALMPDLVSPGTVLGPLLEPVRRALDLPPLDVVAPATHDTGSAVAGTPLLPGWAYISSGTWSLVGVERTEPLLHPEAARANFTNEGGVSSTIRFLKNVMGLWILESCRKEWNETGWAADHEALLARAAALPGPPALLFPDDPGFFNPPSMLGAIAAYLRRTGQPEVTDPPAVARVVLDSLALRYASVLRLVETLTGDAVAGLHVVGGGSRNTYLNQAAADATGLPVLAGPVEATALGNLAVQALALGRLASLAEARAAIAELAPPRRFEPRPDEAGRWAMLTARYRELEAPNTRDPTP